jgi:AcrR family transcriptional regulator
MERTAMARRQLKPRTREVETAPRRHTEPARGRPHAPPPSAPAARARRSRGADTRQLLIDAALDVFGRLGFEGASTRAIAKAANANLAAIVYHFGGKEALYLAVAEHVAQSIFGRVGPTLAAVAGPNADLSDPAVARAGLERLVETFVQVMLGSAEAERWARFIIREQMQPTAAFDVIYRFMNGAAATATRLVAAVTGEPESDALKLRAITLMGQVMVFRIAETLVLRRMGWRSIGDRQRRAITAVVKENLTAILGRSAP